MKQKQGVIPRILITLLAAGLLFMGGARTLLGIAGNSATAAVTSIRREGGERAAGAPGRYTYNIGYTFALPDGRTIDGFSKKIGDSVYLKADQTGAVQVRYFSAFPRINAMERDTGAGQLILSAAGAFLLFLVNRGVQRAGRGRKPPRRRRNGPAGGAVIQTKPVRKAPGP